jgi:hypothetical protein
MEKLNSFRVFVPLNITVRCSPLWFYRRFGQCARIVLPAVILSIEILSVKSALAGMAIATATGTITAGTDNSGVFGATKASLVGKNYTLVIKIDDSLIKTTTSGNPPYFSQLNSTPNLNPITSATITINGVTLSSDIHSIKNNPYAPSSIFQNAATRATSIHLNDSYATPGGGLFSTSLSIGYNSPPFTPSYNWEAPVDYSPKNSGPLAMEFDYFYINGTSSASVSPVDGTVTTYTMSGRITPTEAPRILFFDPAEKKLKDVTDSKVTVLTGELIYLVAIADGKPAQPKAWDVKGNPIGDYLARNFGSDAIPECVGGPGCAALIAQPDFSRDFTRFYWTTLGSYTVQYNSVSGSATATFSVLGPTNVNVSAQPANVAVITYVLNCQKKPVKSVVWGNYSTIPGINFAAQQAQGPTPGILKWQRLIISGEVDYQYLNEQSQKIPLPTGLDNSVFYPSSGSGDDANDSPSFSVPSLVTSLAESSSR